METTRKEGESMTNTSKLKGRIAEKGFTLSSLSEAVHISRPCVRKKINGTVDFKASEIERMCEVLEISKNDLCTYFFIADVPKTDTVA